MSNDGNYGLLSFRGVAGQNSFLVDGTDTTEQFYNENAGRTRISSQISQDAVQEFQVVSSNYSAGIRPRHGRHCQHRDQERHQFAAWHRLLVLPQHRVQRARSVQRIRSLREAPADRRLLGGAIKRDKLFYFINTDVTRRNYPMTSSLSTTAVNPATETWNLCGVGTSTQPPATPAQCAAINALLPRFYGQIPRTLGQELYFGRLDYHFSDRNSFSASFNFLHERSPNGIQSAISSTTRQPPLPATATTPLRCAMDGPCGPPSWLPTS